MADPRGGLHGREAGSLLVLGSCGQMLLEHGQLQCRHGVLGRPQVWAVEYGYLWFPLIKSFIDKQMLREFSTTTPALPQMLKEPSGEGCRDGIDWEFRVDMYTLL